MSRELSAATTLESLKKEAKRWLKALRANAEHARARLTRVWPTAPAKPGLRDVQHALALEHGRMSSLERLELWQCAGIIDAGVAHLAGLPRLREISLDGLPNVTREGAAVFPAHVRANYSA
jgi:hypothetical protein